MPSIQRIDIILVAVGTLIGAGIAAGYAAWRAVSLDAATSSARWSEFGEAMIFPGWLIILAVAAMVWMGWRANIDQS